MINLAVAELALRRPDTSLPGSPARAEPKLDMNTAPRTYAIRVDGHLDDHWSAWLGELDMTRDDDGTTTFTVSVADQAQLHGVLAGLRDVGAVLLELRTTDASAATGDRGSSARCAPSAAPSVPPPPTTPTAVLGSGAVR